MPGAGPSKAEKPLALSNAEEAVPLEIDQSKASVEPDQQMLRFEELHLHQARAAELAAEIRRLELGAK